MKKAILTIAVIIIILNLPPISWLGGYDDVYYSNACGSFTYGEANYAGRNFSLVMDNFNAFKSINKQDTVLYRITPKNYLKFWRWGNYLFKEKYKLPYKSWTEIEIARGPLRNKTNWQDF